MIKHATLSSLIKMNNRIERTYTETEVNAYIKKRIIEYVSDLDNDETDGWHGTDRELFKPEFQSFARSINIDITEEDYNE